MGPTWGESRCFEPFDRFEPFGREKLGGVSPAILIEGDSMIGIYIERVRPQFAPKTPQNGVRPLANNRVETQRPAGVNQQLFCFANEVFCKLQFDIPVFDLVTDGRNYFMVRN